ncbi:MAG: ribosomal-protein-alanine N-acetyltransferase [Candidatus Azotimanducaceae bacterium]
MLRFQIVPLTKEHALDIFGWRYPAPYDFYDPPNSNDPEPLLDPIFQFHSVLDENTDFLGFCSFGIDGQVLGGDYSMPAIDIGLGMKPAETGQGLGYSFFGAILNFAVRNYHFGMIRLTVADFNERAISLYKKFGFEEQQRFVNRYSRVSYTILILRIER